MYRLLAPFVCAALLAPAPSLAQDRPTPLDVLDLSASAGEEVAADTAVVILGVVRDGSDVSALTQDVDNTLSHALSDAKATANVQASSGGYSTQPRFDKPNQGPSGWSVHGELIFRSHDFGALGKLVGRLTSANVGMQISSSGFEVSPELRQSAEGLLIERAIAAFKAKAATAVKALGYASFTIREVRIGNTNGVVQQRPAPMMARSMISSQAASLPLEPGHSSVEVEVSGSVQMRH